MLEKIKNLFKRFLSLFKRIKESLATPVVTKPVESIVDVSRPPAVPMLKPVPKPGEITVGKPGDEVRISGPTAAFLGASNGNVPEPPNYGAPAGQTIDRRQVRDLSGEQGNMGIAEGDAYSTHTFTVKEAPGTIVEITTGQTQSDLGVCDKVTLAGPDNEVADGLFNAHAKIKFVASGVVQEVHVILHKAGAVAVQRN